MSSRESISSGGTKLLSSIIVLIGIAIIVRTVAAGGGALTVGVLIGAIFVAIGCARIYLATRSRG